MTKMMRAARMYECGKPMELENIPVPSIRPTEVLVRVKACGIVPNLHNILTNWTTWFPHLPLPKLPAIFGLDPTGVVEQVGEQVYDFKPGDRVYVNPARYCGSCRACRAGNTTGCSAYTFNGYFGFTARSPQMFEHYPYGGLCEYMPAPQYSLVKLPDNLSFETAARLGYLGTAYRALKKANVGPGSTVLINGISGTLGLGAVALALAMGARKILGTARNESLFQRVKDLAAPGRIEIHNLGNGSIAEWANQVTRGEGVDAVIDALGPGASYEPLVDALRSLHRSGHLVNIGAVAGEVPLDLHWIMDNDINVSGSAWFTTGQGQEMADMVESGALDLSFFEHNVFPLEQVNQAISGIENRNGGFSNYVIAP
ncbi:alcohol dehydrogenase catalytic domain-containing protein [Pseudomonas sp. JM0905a]|uniref:alcohol dehydrogenase catalytic domain-containing protein n=1 Tax=Pseudomonas sp. JM0905a TaxID=2772484 RepID=UPI0016856AA2|nr:alcohol dehydrogenase catalytic domain-containing protein [Pseudomonas sp. JM0905a]MBD2835547.1 alcohol dehydrogenase catalytic domain-containing protein [Pseudomonas sp. JM0905a]